MPCQQRVGWRAQGAGRGWNSIGQRNIPYHMAACKKKTPGWAWGLAGHQSVGGEQLLVHHLHIYMIKIAVRYFFPCYVCPSKQLLSHPTRSTLLFCFSDSLPYFLGEVRRVSKELCVQC